MKKLLFILAIAVSTKAYGAGTDDPASLSKVCVDQLSGQIQVNCSTSMNMAFISSGTIPSFAVLGATTSSNAPTGRIGEYMESKSNGNNSCPTSGNYGDATSLTLTPGDWDVTYILTGARDTATWSRLDAGINTTSGNSSADLSLGENFVTFIFANTATAIENVYLSVPSYRVSLASATTYYAKVRCQYTANLPVYSYRLSARRVR